VIKISHLAICAVYSFWKILPISKLYSSSGFCQKNDTPAPVKNRKLRLRAPLYFIWSWKRKQKYILLLQHPCCAHAILVNTKGIFTFHSKFDNIVCGPHALQSKQTSLNSRSLWR